MKAVIGLGNPGRTYEATRHNVGFQVIRQLAQESEIPLSEKGFKSRFGRGTFNHIPVLLVEPLTYMNLSGQAVKELVAAFNLTPSDLIVVHDDIDLELGRIRIKRRGGDGGHKGIRSIREHLGTDEFLRVKVGVGRPGSSREVADYVLSPFDPQEQEQLKEALSKAVGAVKLLILGEVDKAMNIYHKSGDSSP
ncbi:MAG TPA: aminoacyl-tRNA hydrolase [Candidatus Limnocylindrales bacterium]|nr:aminoacyl-tRNA hydrolase [Candidatus Limnocylindrales bacterium]